MHSYTLEQAAKLAEEALGNNIQWLTDALDLAIRQGDKETIRRLAELEHAWVALWNLPSFRVYGNYSSGNYGAHALVFTDPNGEQFFFSYKTLVAFTHNGRRYVHTNDWGPTTGKHLNAIDDNKKNRLSYADFVAAFERCYPRVKLAA